MRCLIAVTLMISGVSLAADEPNPARLTAPAGWTGETISLPPGFAPDMKFKGTETIRFAPGMMKPTSDSFFSYAFVFDLQRQPELTEAVVKEEFLKYFRGLCKTVLNGRLPDLDSNQFTLKLEPVKAETKPNSDAPAADESNQYTGILDWIEPFATRKPQKLNLEIRTWASRGRNYIFVCVSPQARDATIWDQLHAIRDDYLKMQTR